MNTTPIDHKIEFMAWLKEADTPYIINQDEMGIVDFLSLGEAIEYWEEGSNIMQLTALRSINNEPIYNHMIVKDQTGETCNDESQIIELLILGLKAFNDRMNAVKTNSRVIIDLGNIDRIPTDEEVSIIIANICKGKQ